MDREEGKEPVSKCPPQWDGAAACIPSTPTNQLAVLPCIEEYDGQFYDTKYNITKECLADGSWNNYTNYTDCLNNPLQEKEWEIFIFLLGYTVSIAALLVAIFIFLYFR